MLQRLRAQARGGQRRAQLVRAFAARRAPRQGMGQAFGQAVHMVFHAAQLARLSQGNQGEQLAAPQADLDASG